VRLRGDLDLIVLTALQKSEERRYQSPAALAQDLQRLQQGQPILARPDSTAYRVRKFVGRHRLGVALAALLVVALVGAASRERLLRGRAEVEARKAKGGRRVPGPCVRRRRPVRMGAARWRQRHRARAARPRRQSYRLDARRSAGGAGRTAQCARTRIHEPRPVRPGHATARALTRAAQVALRRDARERGAGHGPARQCPVQAGPLRGCRAVAAWALEQRRRLLGNNSAETAESIEHLATLLEQRSEYAAAEPLHREALAIRQRVFGDSALEVADGLNNVGLVLYRRGAHNEAETMYRRALDITMRRLGEDHPSTAKTVQNLAQTRDAGQPRGGGEALSPFPRGQAQDARRCAPQCHHWPEQSRRSAGSPSGSSG
jgi:eukaryotic-like serine/threonine-protein kinase